MPDEKLIQTEYKELGENARLLTTTRLASLTISFAFQAALVTALLQPENKGALRVMLKVVAILLVILSAAMEYRIITIFRGVCYRAAFLEKSLGFQIYSNIEIDDWSPITIRNGLILIHAGLVVFWVLSIVLRA